MIKFYYIKTNGYDMIVSVDDEKKCRYLTEKEYFPNMLNNNPEEQRRKAYEFLEAIEDNSSWEDDCTFEQIFEDHAEDVEILAELEVKW